MVLWEILLTDSCDTAQGTQRQQVGLPCLDHKLHSRSPANMMLQSSSDQEIRPGQQQGQCVCSTIRLPLQPRSQGRRGEQGLYPAKGTFWSSEACKEGGQTRRRQASTQGRLQTRGVLDSVD
jgi:hypothetical protein